MLVGLPEVLQAVKVIAMARIWYVRVVKAAPLGLKTEDLQHQPSGSQQLPQGTTLGLPMAPNSRMVHQWCSLGHFQEVVQSMVQSAFWAAIGVCEVHLKGYGAR